MRSTGTTTTMTMTTKRVRRRRTRVKARLSSASSARRCVGPPRDAQLIPAHFSPSRPPSNGSDGSKSESEADDDDDDDDSSDDEDDTAELLRELEKIKRERAEEKARLEAEAASVEGTSREAEIATGNPLLNLAAALGQGGSGASEAGTSASGFSVKRRWDDDLIFKNQAVGSEDKGRKKEFVNDLLRTEFHRKFMGKCVAC